MASEFLKKSAKQREWGVLHQMMYRYLSLPFIWILKLKFHPNIVTIIGFLCKLFGIYFYFTFNKIPAVVLFQVGIVMDWCDGGVARLTNKTSKFGKMLDSTIDIFVYRLFYVILSIAFYLVYDDPIILLAALILFGLVSVREMICINASEDKGENYSTKRETTKTKFSIPSLVLTKIIDFNKVAFPFVIFFPFDIVLIFYSFNMLIEAIRILFYIFISFSSIQK